jgi:hypothetical protein
MMLAALADVSFLEGLGIWAVRTLQMAGWLLIGLLMAGVPVFAVYGTMFALSKLAGRIRRSRSGP